MWFLWFVSHLGWMVEFKWININENFTTKTSSGRDGIGVCFSRPVKCWESLTPLLKGGLLKASFYFLTLFSCGRLVWKRSFIARPLSLRRFTLPKVFWFRSGVASIMWLISIGCFKRPGCLTGLVACLWKHAKESRAAKYIQTQKLWAQMLKSKWFLSSRDCRC